jgi:L-glutamine-phosphate cytidylyltransferase
MSTGEHFGRNALKIPLSDAETFRLKPDGTLAEIGNTPQTMDEIEGQYMGLLKFTPKGWNEICSIIDGMKKDQGEKMHMTGVLKEVLLKGKIPVTCLPYEEEWREYDTPGDIQ